MNLKNFLFSGGRGLGVGNAIYIIRASGDGR